MAQTPSAIVASKKGEGRSREDGVIENMIDPDFRG
jgi:hypothetical protein